MSIPLDQLKKWAKVAEDFVRDEMQDWEKRSMAHMPHDREAQPIKIVAHEDIPTLYMKAGDSTSI